MTSTVKSSLPALEELKRAPQWVCFDEHKVPFSPTTGVEAKANKPATWGIYAQAVKAWRSNKSKYRGLGREFVKEQGFTGLDLDKCFDADGNLTPYARYVVHLMDSYTEYSPSGQGLHIWVRGTLPENINTDIKADGDCRIEAYDCKRYFTVTGKHFPSTPTTIEDRQAEIDALYAETMERREAAKKPRIRQGKSSPQNSIGDTSYGLGALDDECRELASTPEGGRNPQLNRSAFSIGQLVGGHALTRITAENALYDAAAQTGLPEREIVRTLRSGIEAGMREPRGVPIKELPGEEYKPDNTIISESTNGNGYHPPTEKEDTDLTPFPEVIIGSQLREVEHEALQALVAAEKRNPTLFVQSAQLKRIGRDEKHSPMIIDVGEAELRNALTNSANYFRLKEKNGEFLKVPVSPPRDVVQGILALPPEEWDFPPLEAIVQTPVMRPDGTIIDVPGYDRATHVYYMPEDGLEVCCIPQHPTQQQVKEAADFLHGFIQDFPFEAQADRANAMGLLLTTVTRQMFRHVPIALIDATKQGTGKGLLTDITSLIATGRASAALCQVSSDEEWDKRITALLMEGASMITIDNMEGVLRSPIIAKILTSDYHKGRVLGLSKTVEVPQRALWVANGNNIQLGGDIPRRSYRIRLISQVSDPWTREDFKYPHLDQAVIHERGKIIAALLTIARGWFEAGEPQPRKKLSKLATFTRWVEVIGGMLSYAGIDGFLENLQELHKEADVDGGAWALFLETWVSRLGTGEYKTAELIEKLNTDKAFSETLPDPLGTLFLKEDKSLSRKLGRHFSKKNGTPYGEHNLRIVQGIDSHTKVATFKVAGYAGYAVLDLTYAQGEKSEEKSEEKPEKEESNFHREGRAKTTPHTPHTPQTIQTALMEGEPQPTPSGAQPELSPVIASLVNTDYYTNMQHWLNKYGKPRPKKPCDECHTFSWYPYWLKSERTWGCLTCQPEIKGVHNAEGEQA